MSARALWTQKSSARPGAHKPPPGPFAHPMFCFFLGRLVGGWAVGPWVRLSLLQFCARVLEYHFRILCPRPVNKHRGKSKAKYGFGENIGSTKPPNKIQYLRGRWEPKASGRPGKREGRRGRAGGAGKNWQEFAGIGENYGNTNQYKETMVLETQFCATRAFTQKSLCINWSVTYIYIYTAV